MLELAARVTPRNLEKAMAFTEPELKCFNCHGIQKRKGVKDSLK